ncbi:MAG TPA: DJ-1/PfpI family protein [Myxococcaceae bacterium]|nr:DJ-1/PfpI family protein [Myxococcaceae bacterium]
MRRTDAASRIVPLLLLVAVSGAARAEGDSWARRNVAIVVYDDVEILDFAGPMEVFTAAGNGAFRVFTVAPTHDPVVSMGVLSIRPDHSIADSPTPDILVLPGGDSRGFSRSPAGMAWVRKVAARDELNMSVCSGAFILAQLGFLDGRAATTHWAAVPRMKSAFPRVQVQTGVRFVDTGRIITTAGVSAGIDGALHVVQRLLGDDVAWETARYMQYLWEPKESAGLSRSAKEALRALVFHETDLANRLLTSAVAANPKDPILVSRLGRAQLLAGRSEEALSTLQKAVALGDGSPLTLTSLANAQLAAGALAAAAASFERLTAVRGAPEDAYGLACARARLGQREQALTALEQALQLGLAPRLVENAWTDGDLESLRGDVRFAQLLARSKPTTRSVQ